MFTSTITIGIIFIILPVILAASISFNNASLVYSQINSTTATTNDNTNLNAAQSNKSMTTVQEEYNNNNTNKIQNGSIIIKPTTFDELDSKINTSLSEAVEIALETSSNSSRAVMSQLDQYNGFAVYIVCIMDPSMNLTHVYVDPANGKVLGSQKASMQEAMMMHGKMFMG